MHTKPALKIFHQLLRNFATTIPQHSETILWNWFFILFYFMIWFFYSNLRDSLGGFCVTFGARNMYAYITTLQHGRSLSKRGVITTVGILKSNFQHSSFSKAKKDKYFIRPKNSPPSKFADSARCRITEKQGAPLLLIRSNVAPSSPW